VAVVGALLALGACSGDQPKAGPSATVGTEPPRTTVTDPFAVPAVIDAAYLNRVLAGLDAVVGDVVRMVVSTKSIPREAYDRLRALYATDTILQVRIDGFQSDIRGGLPGYRLPTPGNKKTDVLDLLSASKSCIFVRVHRDYAAVSVGALPELSTQWIAIRPLDRSRDPAGYNAVGWAYIYDGFERGFLPPPSDPCAVA
jgi:hypothetical protein